MPRVLCGSGTPPESVRFRTLAKGAPAEADAPSLVIAKEKASAVLAEALGDSAFKAQETTRANLHTLALGAWPKLPHPEKTRADGEETSGRGWRS